MYILADFYLRVLKIWIALCMHAHQVALATVVQLRLVVIFIPQLVLSHHGQDFVVTWAGMTAIQDVVVL